MKTIRSNEFKKYGLVLDIDTKEIVEYLKNKAKMPENGNIYIPHEDEFYLLKEVKEIEKKYFGQLSLQAGYCNGFNTKLNCLEYHATHEINVAATDLVLILGHYNDIKNDQIKVEDLEIFKVNKGETILVYPGTLHFSPCRVDDSGFKMAVFLHKGRNLPLESKTSDPKLWAVNKWLYAHKDTKQARDGAYVGIVGENIEIKY